MKTRIAVYTETRNFWGGSFQYAKAFVEALAGLDRHQYDVRVWHEEDKEWLALLSRLDFPSHVLSRYDFPHEFVPTAKKILSALHENNVPETRKQEFLQILQPFSEEATLAAWRPHVVIGPQMGGQHYVPGARHIGAIHDLMHRYEARFPEVGTPAELKAREALFTGMIDRYDAILVDSKVGKRHVLDSYSHAREDQIRILPFAAFGEILKCEQRKPNFILPDKFFFYPTQFWQHKNHAGLARAVGRLISKYPDIHVLTAGNTAQNGFAGFQQVAHGMGIEHCFSLSGYISVEEMAWCYRHARALIMPTFFGPTNIPPLEAMALDCPVATSGIYGIPDQCGNAALYFPPDDIPAMANVLERLWTDDALCDDLRRKGQARTRLCSQAMFSKQVLRIVREVAEGAEEAAVPEADKAEAVTAETASGADLIVENTTVTTKMDWRENPPFISIVVPTYNRAAMLPVTLDSLLAQNYPQDRFEVVVCNNNSTDTTADILECYARNYPGRFISVFEGRQGVHYARNRAAHHTCGDILYYTDDDMLADAGMLAAFADLFSRHPRLGSATGKVLPLWESSPPDWVRTLCQNYLLSLMDLGEQEIVGPKDMVFSCHQAMRRDVFFRSGGFHPENTAGEWIGDGETGLNLTIGKLGYLFGYTPLAVTQHMIPESRTTQEYLNKRLANQGNCDSYTDYREHHYTLEQLASRMVEHSHAAERFRALAIRQQKNDDLRWHLNMAQTHYYLNRFKYDKRLATDYAWRELVRRDDWLSPDLYPDLPACKAITPPTPIQDHVTPHELSAPSLSTFAGQPWDRSIKLRRLEQKLKTLRQKSAQNMPSTVLFIVSRASCWQYEGLYQQMQASAEFEPYVCIVPFTVYGDQDIIRNMGLCLERFAGQGYRVVNTYNPNTGTVLDVRAALSPDIVFFSDPWDSTLPMHSIAHFTDALTCYVPYGIYSANMQKDQYDKPFHHILDLFFCESELHKTMAKTYGSFLDSSLIVSGYAKIDPFLSHTVFEDRWKPLTPRRKRIIWAPHYTVLKYDDAVSYSCFLDMAEFMFTVAERYAPQTQWVFKPHPDLKPTLARTPSWGWKKAEQYWDRWKNLPNGQLEDGNYLDLFQNSDAMIMDSISFVSEYMATGKPSLFTIRDSTIHEQWNEYGKQAFDLLYHTKQLKRDIVRFVENVVIGGHDDKKAQRDAFVAQYLVPPHNRTAAENAFAFLQELLQEAR